MSDRAAASARRRAPSQPGTAGPPPPPDRAGALLAVRALSVRLPGQTVPVLREVVLDLRPGEVVGLSGRSGAGKSTLLHAIAGLVPWSRPARVTGDVLLGTEPIGDLDPAQRAPLVATCLDRPEAQLFLSRVEQELAGARRLHGGSFLDQAARVLGVDRLAGRRVVELSSGQRQRVALAVALAAAPRPVLLDEPTANLDEDGVEALVALLADVRRAGGAVLVAEQAGWRLGAAVDRWVELRDGCLAPCPPPTPARLVPPPPGEGRPVLHARALWVRRGDVTLVDGADVLLRAGEVVVLTGPNGAGKSSLARVLAGHGRSVGAVRARWDVRPPWVALMLPSPDLQLFADTVGGELRLAGTGERTAAATLERHGLAALAGRAPWSLSRGERQRLVHAALDCLAPPVMVIDEPGQGLDAESLTELAATIREGAAAGRAYLLVTHRRDLADLGQRRLHLEGGRLEEVAR